MPLSAIFASGASCDITPSPAMVDIDNDYGQNPGRVTVFGSGDGKFNENTKVEINCNVDGSLPGANENIVAAKVTPSASQLSYTGYCTYKASSKDIDYKVGITIQLDDVVCSGGFCYSRISCTKGSDSFAKVTVKASTKGAVAPTPTPVPVVPIPVQCGGLNQNICTSCSAVSNCYSGCNAPYINNGKGGCIECGTNMVYDGGNCASCGWEGLRPCSGNTCNGGLTMVKGLCQKSEPQPTPTKPTGDEKELRFGIDWKWTLISVPYGDISSEYHSCLSKIYYYDKDAGKYQKVTDLKDKNLIGKGLWAKKTTGNKVGDCTIKYTGRFLSSQTINLKKGWNLIGIQTERSFDTTKTSCKITGGPFMYSGFLVDSKGAWSATGKPQGYMKRDYLNYGSGYWIKVADDCKLSNEEEEEEPPAAPEADAQASSGQTIEPQGGRGRRYVEDAG